MGDTGCGAQCAKIVILLINFIFGLIGIVLLGFGIFLVVDAKAMHKQFFIPAGSSAEMILIAAGVILIVGLIIMAITVVGCCAVAKKNTGCLTFYSCVLIMVLILQVIAVILAGVFYNQIIDSLDDQMLIIVNKEYGYKNDSTVFIDTVQKELHCCGVTAKGPLDWEYSKWNNDTRGIVPESCCTPDGKGGFVDLKKCREYAYHNETTDRSKYIYTEGCDSKVDGLIKQYVGILIGVVIGVVLIQVVFIIVTCLLRSSMARGYEYV
jgi:small-conductance mechanosensitive channel